MWTIAFGVLIGLLLYRFFDEIVAVLGTIIVAGILWYFWQTDVIWRQQMEQWGALLAFVIGVGIVGVIGSIIWVKLPKPIQNFLIKVFTPISKLFVPKDNSGTKNSPAKKFSKESKIIILVSIILIIVLSVWFQTHGYPIFQ